MRFLKGNSIFNGKTMLPADTVLVLDNNNLLSDIVTETAVEKSSIETLEGMITPGFVNAHCHLELSHLKDKIAQHTGLPGFAREVITKRNTVSKEEINEHMQAADREMYHKGIVAVGDISNGADSFDVKKDSSVFYHTFIELIGLNPANQQVIFNKGLELLQTLKNYNLHGSLAPHAPYSTSAELIKSIADYNSTHHTSLSIHNQESEEEQKFFDGRPNGFNALFAFLGLDLSWYKAPGGSSLQTYVHALNEQWPSLLVHNTFTSAQDSLAAASKNTYWCFCPGANLYIENRLPDFDVFKAMPATICFGTDSLASNTQLDVLAEANLILNRTSAFSLETILQGLTSNAAQALSLQDSYGRLMPGKNTGLNLLRVNNNQLHFIKKIS